MLYPWRSEGRPNCKEHRNKHKKQNTTGKINGTSRSDISFRYSSQDINRYEATSHHYTQTIFSRHKGRKIDEGTTDVMIDSSKKKHAYSTIVFFIATICKSSIGQGACFYHLLKLDEHEQASGCFSYILHTAGTQIWPSGMKVAEIVTKTAMPTVPYKYNIVQ